MGKTKLILLLIVISWLSACKSVKPVIVHDTISNQVVVKDIQWKYDSVYIDRWHEKIKNGDTILIHDSVWAYKLYTCHDTLVDTVTRYEVRTEPYETIKEVVKYKRDLCWWIGFIALLCGLGYIIYNLYKYVKRKRD